MDEAGTGTGLLPGGWPSVARSAVLQAVSLASTAVTVVRGWCANSRLARVRLKGENERLEAEVATLEEELRIKDARMTRVPAARRPHYPPVERMAVLELKAQRGWSKAETARRFLVEPKTIASWMKRLDEEGETALVRIPTPVNRFPDFVRYLVRRLKTLCPLMGKRKIAEVLARAGLHLGATTVQRMVKADGPKPAEEDAQAQDGEAQDADEPAPHTVTANYPDHVQGVDLTVVPTLGGLWSMLFPFALPQVWPFCWWVAVAQDHFSRKATGFAVFPKQPTSLQVRTFLGRAFSLAGKVPKYIVCDKGKQFWCDGFKKWARRRSIKPRYGAVGKYGSIAVIERFMWSLKDECTRRIPVPLRLGSMRKEIGLYVDWHNHHRPCQSLNGRTPDEVYHDRVPANEKPRYEPRRKWPRDSLCAAPWAEVRGRRGVRLQLVIRYLEGHKHLPVVRLTPAA